MRNTFKLLFLIFIIAVSAFTGMFYYYDKPSDMIPAEGFVFNIEPGENLYTVSDDLFSLGLTRSSIVLKIISRIKKTDNRIKSGQYLIKAGMSTYDIHNLIVSGSGILYKITIPEGFTARRIASLFEEKGITSGSDFLDAVKSREIIEKFNIPADNLEGFLFPDSYFFPLNYPADKVVDFMVENFFSVIKADNSFLTAEELYGKVILASIIEREYRVEKEAPLISSVFINRLDRQIPLGSCATVEYVITEIEGKPHPEYLTYDDIKIESDYNTYIHQGLPPGPICNPGKVALYAAHHPAETDYLYFLLKDRGKGEHYFSRRLSEHNKARILYLKK